MQAGNDQDEAVGIVLRCFEDMCEVVAGIRDRDQAFSDLQGRVLQKVVLLFGADIWKGHLHVSFYIHHHLGI